MARARGESATSPRRIEAVERQAQALQLRKQGMNYDEIAQALGYADRSGAYVAVRSALSSILEPAVEELRDVEGEALNVAQEAIWQKVVKGDLSAVNTFLRISERRARLFGLDKPVPQTLRADLDLFRHGIEITYTAPNGEAIDAPEWVETHQR
ncbi:MAG: hypothetical protein LC121_18010 [Anaerolineae bacterium]|nr:hypothetical protein [Anaerolineae bacterium]